MTAVFRSRMLFVDKVHPGASWEEEGCSHCGHWWS